MSLIKDLFSEEKRIMKVLASKLPEEVQVEEDVEDDKEKNEE